jgi:hypothetical protein
MPDTIQFRFSTGFKITVASGECEDFCAVEENGELTWTNEILDDLIHRLEELAELSDIGQVDVTVYGESADGTHNLWLDLKESNASPRYAMGMVIFHQLLYTLPLTARRQN